MMVTRTMDDAMDDAMKMNSLTRMSNTISVCSKCPLCGMEPEAIFHIDGFYAIDLKNPFELLRPLQYPLVPKITTVHSWFGYAHYQLNSVCSSKTFAPGFTLENRGNGGFRTILSKAFNPNARTLWSSVSYHCSCGTDWESSPFIIFNEMEKRAIIKAVRGNKLVEINPLILAVVKS